MKEYVLIIMLCFMYVQKMFACKLNSNCFYVQPAPSMDGHEMKNLYHIIRSTANRRNLVAHQSRIMDASYI